LAAAIQTTALAVGGMALILLTVTRGELLATWEKAAPVDAPNRFIIGIQPDQRQVVGEALRALAPEARLSPMVRGRLQQIRGRDVSPEDYQDERAQRLVEREFNLSHATDLPPGNTISAGRWFDAAELDGSAPVAAASVEAGLAATLGIEVGDEMRFMVAGEPLTVRVVGLRHLDWSTMQVNFFVLLPPPALAPYPASDITSFHLPVDGTPQLNALVARFPNLTVIDVTVILRQMQAMLGQVATAVQFLFLFTVLAGVIVLYGALLAVFDERRLEFAVMRALGARSRQIRQALYGELLGIGVLAGFLSALAANLVGIVLARQLFELELAFNVWTLPAAMLLGALFAMLSGRRAVAALITAPALTTLRAAQ
jgi:putative ABC transport system permease protein